MESYAVLRHLIPYVNTDRIYRFDDVRAFEETILSSIPKGKVSLAVSDQQIVIQGMKNGSSELFMQRLKVFLVISSSKRSSKSDRLSEKYNLRNKYSVHGSNSHD